MLGLLLLIGKFKNNSLPGYGSLSLESKDSIDGMATARGIAA